jgi:hypothetical protein
VVEPEELVELAIYRAAAGAMAVDLDIAAHEAAQVYLAQVLVEEQAVRAVLTLVHLICCCCKWVQEEVEAMEETVE